MYRKYNIKPSIKMYWDSDEVGIELLDKGPYWTMLPDIVADSDPRIVALKHPKEWKAEYEVCLIWNTSKTLEDLKNHVFRLI